MFLFNKNSQFSFVFLLSNKNLCILITIVTSRHYLQVQNYGNQTVHWGLKCSYVDKKKENESVEFPGKNCMHIAFADS